MGSTRGKNSVMAGVSGLELQKIKPKTINQQRAFQAWDDEYHLVMHGYSGTGKTFIGTYLAMNEIQKNPKIYTRMTIIRSSVPSRDMGFLPGSIAEKAAAYEEPYETIFSTLYGRGDAYGTLKKRGMIDFRTTSYLRGITWDNTIVVVDEIQNMTFQELDTIMTRIGEDTRIIFCGDYRQTDLVKDKEKQGLNRFLDTLGSIDDFDHVEFGINDIIRSDIVKKYIIAKENQKGN